MKNKNLYKKPEIEIIEVELESIVANSPNTSFDFSEKLHEGRSARSKGLNWDNNQ